MYSTQLNSAHATQNSSKLYTPIHRWHPIHCRTLPLNLPISASLRVEVARKSSEFGRGERKSDFYYYLALWYELLGWPGKYMMRGVFSSSGKREDAESRGEGLREILYQAYDLRGFFRFANLLANADLRIRGFVDSRIVGAKKKGEKSQIRNSQFAIVEIWDTH